MSIKIPVLKNNEEILTTVDTRTTGDSFGELALIKDQPRSASVFCNTNCHFTVLSKEDYMAIIGKIESKKLDDFIDFLRTIPVLKSWAKKDLEVLTYHFKPITYQRKQVVFKINTTPKFVFIVKSGEFEVMKPVTFTNSKGDEESYMAKIALLGKGEMFCDEEVIHNKKTSAACVCYSTVGELLYISAKDFLLKFENEDIIRDFQAKQNSKSSLRDKRLKGFKDYLEVKSRPMSIFEKKRSTTPAIILPKKFYGSVSPPPTVRCPPLTEKKIEKIREKALGKINLANLYIHVNSGSNYSGLEESLVEQESYHRKNKSIASMKCHRPGGYYRANLKKSWIGYRNVSIDY